jgi:hypothetical protein
MRYLIGILLLASPAVAGEPAYSWRTRGDDPDRIYLYLDGKQVGGWSYPEKHYRAFDGKDWGPPTDKAPVKPPANRVIVTPPQMPTVHTQPNVLPLRGGPLKVRMGTFLGQIFLDGAARVAEEIPGAIVDSIKKRNYQLDYNFSVTPSAQQPGGQTSPPIPSPPARSPERRRLFPRQ